MNPEQADDFSQRLSALLQSGKSTDSTAPESTSDATETDSDNAADETAVHDTGPVGAGDHIVRDGDSIASIANEAGHFWQTIWDDPTNETLRATREDPNVLLPGDRVTVPEKRRKDVSIEPEKRHRFKRRGEPASLHVQLLDNNVPRAQVPFELIVDNRPVAKGITDADGNVSASIPSNAKKAMLLVGDGDERIAYRIALGGIDPISELTGVQQRLQNLGFGCEETGKLDERTRQALRSFQTQSGLTASGDPDPETREKLEAAHGS